MRRYVISNKGKSELAQLRGRVDEDVKRQLRLLAYCCDNTSNKALAADLRRLTELPGTGG